MYRRQENKGRDAAIHSPTLHLFVKRMYLKWITQEVISVLDWCSLTENEQRSTAIRESSTHIFKSMKTLLRIELTPILVQNFISIGSLAA